MANQSDSGPPTDTAGNEFSTDWFDDGDLSDGKLTDERGNEYSPFAGALEPIEGRCNAVLRWCEDRYPETRFCTQTAFDDDFCRNHRGQKNVRAEDLNQTTFFADNIDNMFRNLPPSKKVFGWGLFAELMGDSQYTFAPEYRTKTFDFSDADVVPPQADDDDIFEVEFAYPTDHTDEAGALYQAAMLQVAMMDITATLMTDGDGGMMEKMEASEAEPVYGEDGTPRDFVTLDQLTEHHLNLPLSRIIKDRPRLLEVGGVSTNVDDNTSSTQLSDGDITLNLEASSGVDDPSPNSFDEEAPSREIADSAGETDTLSGTQEYASPE